MAKPKTPLLTVDCVILDAPGRLLLIQRGRPPFAGCWALPGGFVDEGESVEEACRREVLEETGVAVRSLSLVGVYSKPGRDPRGPTCSIAYFAKVTRRDAKAGDDAQAVAWVDQWRKLPLAFDHKNIIRDALRKFGGTEGS